MVLLWYNFVSVDFFSSLGIDAFKQLMNDNLEYLLLFNEYLNDGVSPNLST